MMTDKQKISIFSPVSYIYLYSVSFIECVCSWFDLGSVGAELRKVSDKVQRNKSSLQLCLSGTTLLPQLFLSQLPVLEDKQTQASAKKA